MTVQCPNKVNKIQQNMKTKHVLDCLFDLQDWKGGTDVRDGPNHIPVPTIMLTHQPTKMSWLWWLKWLCMLMSVLHITSKLRCFWLWLPTISLHVTTVAHRRVRYDNKYYNLVLAKASRCMCIACEPLIWCLWSCSYGSCLATIPPLWLREVCVCDNIQRSLRPMIHKTYLYCRPNSIFVFGGRIIKHENM